jgi:ADP-ribose pyrophosphatase YjhB (NUDIX family)
VTALDRRDHPERPIVGVGVVVWHGEHVLLVRRSRPPRQGQWSLPGGAQLLGETLAESAAREVAEETGVVIGPPVLVTCLDLIERDDADAVAFHYTLVDFTAEALGDVLQAGDDAAEAAWFGPERLPGLGLWSRTLEVIEVAARLRPAPWPAASRSASRPAP